MGSLALTENEMSSGQFTEWSRGMVEKSDDQNCISKDPWHIMRTHPGAKRRAKRIVRFVAQRKTDRVPFSQTRTQAIEVFNPP